MLYYCLAQVLIWYQKEEVYACPSKRAGRQAKRIGKLFGAKR